MVVPRLRESCRCHGARFQAMDLLRGIGEEASLDQQTIKAGVHCPKRLRHASTPISNVSWLTLPKGPAFLVVPSRRQRIVAHQQRGPMRLVRSTAARRTVCRPGGVGRTKLSAPSTRPSSAPAADCRSRARSGGDTGHPRGIRRSITAPYRLRHDGSPTAEQLNVVGVPYDGHLVSRTMSHDSGAAQQVLGFAAAAPESQEYPSLRACDPAVGFGVIIPPCQTGSGGLRARPCGPGCTTTAPND